MASVVLMEKIYSPADNDVMSIILFSLLPDKTTEPNRFVTQYSPATSQYRFSEAEVG